MVKELQLHIIHVTSPISHSTTPQECANRASLYYEKAAGSESEKQAAGIKAANECFKEFPKSSPSSTNSSTSDSGNSGSSFGFFSWFFIYYFIFLIKILSGYPPSNTYSVTGHNHNW